MMHVFIYHKELCPGIINYMTAYESATESR